VLSRHSLVEISSSAAPTSPRLRHAVRFGDTLFPADVTSVSLWQEVGSALQGTPARRGETLVTEGGAV
jgi:hypothetical protein